MKYFIVLACLVVVAYGIAPEVVEKFKAKVHALGGECKTEIGASDDDIAPMIHHEPPTTEKGKCFVACMHKKFGFQDAAGKISKEGSLAEIEKLKPLDAELYGKMKKVADHCLAEVSDEANECETAAKMFDCVKAQKKELGVESIDFEAH